MQLFIYDNMEISISIMAKNEKEAKQKLTENVINPSLFTKENEMDLENIEFD